MKKSDSFSPQSGTPGIANLCVKNAPYRPLGRRNSVRAFKRLIRSLAWEPEALPLKNALNSHQASYYYAIRLTECRSPAKTDRNKPPLGRKASNRRTNILQGQFGSVWQIGPGSEQVANVNSFFAFFTQAVSIDEGIEHIGDLLTDIAAFCNLF